MLFNSYNFLIFFIVVLLIYFTIPSRGRYIWLLISSYYFYFEWNHRYLILLIIATIITYFCAVRIGKLNDKVDNRKKKNILIMNIVCLLSMLFFYKYFNFVLLNLNYIISFIGFKNEINKYEILLPVGISFYTFQALGYVIDVYRGKIKAESNIFKCALFISYFPTISSGPIERAEKLLAQINELHKINIFNYNRIKNGVLLSLWGLFLKMVIADRIVTIVDTTFNNYQKFGSIELIIGSIFFAIQIYCDFSSYSYIACGISQIIGIELTNNFNNPYFAVSISDFWRRWHISLSSWLRDYIYISLGGNRCSKKRKYLNIIIVFLVSGIWHGANWTYVVWGCIHGIYQVIGEITKNTRSKVSKFLRIEEKSKGYKILQMFTTFILVDLAWIFFRADNIYNALEMIKIIFTKWNIWRLFDGGVYNLGLSRIEFNIAIISIMIMLCKSICNYLKISVKTVIARQHIVIRWSIYYILLFYIIILGIYGPQYSSGQFIYFKF